ncbi:MAG TPA: hypothetical protein VFM18_10655, partial [Methanosarcina sp.]|nr:hypothetical protein [Methanosarcina sp.]
MRRKKKRVSQLSFLPPLLIVSEVFMLLSKVAETTLSQEIEHLERSAKTSEDDLLKQIEEGNPSFLNVYAIYDAAVSKAAAGTNVKIKEFIYKNRISGISTNNIKKIIAESREYRVATPFRGGPSTSSPMFLATLAWYTKRSYLDTLIPKDSIHIDIAPSEKSLGASKPDFYVRSMMMLSERNLRWVKNVGRATSHLFHVNLHIGMFPEFVELEPTAKDILSKVQKSLVHLNSTYHGNLCQIPAYLVDEATFPEVARDCVFKMTEYLVNALKNKATSATSWYGGSHWIGNSVRSELTLIEGEG